MSNHPASARAIELAHSDGHGLLAHHGSSYGNLFSGDAARAVLTMSGVGRRKEGRLGAGYFGYFSRPQQAARTFLGLVVEIARERRAAAAQRRRDVEPRVHRGWSYALLRAFTTIISRDVSVEGVINDIARAGPRSTSTSSATTRSPTTRARSGPTRSPCSATSTVRSAASTARSSGRRGRTASSCCPTTARPRAPRSSSAAGETLAELVGRLCGAAMSGDTDAERGKTESTAWLRQAAPRRRPGDVAAADVPVVLGSGSLGLDLAARRRRDG